MIPTSLVIAKLPQLSLQNLLSLRTLGTAILSDIKEELYSKEYVMVNILDFDLDPTHYIMVTVLLFFLYGQYKYYQGQHSFDIELQKIDRFKNLRKFTSELIFIFTIIFTKNIEDVH